MENKTQNSMDVMMKIEIQNMVTILNDVIERVSKTDTTRETEDLLMKQVLHNTIRLKTPCKVKICQCDVLVKSIFADSSNALIRIEDEEFEGYVQLFSLPDEEIIRVLKYVRDKISVALITEEPKEDPKAEVEKLVAQLLSAMEENGEEVINVSRLGLEVDGYGITNAIIVQNQSDPSKQDIALTDDDPAAHDTSYWYASICYASNGFKEALQSIVKDYS